MTLLRYTLPRFLGSIALAATAQSDGRFDDT